MTDDAKNSTPGTKISLILLKVQFNTNVGWFSVHKRRLCSLIVRKLRGGAAEGSLLRWFGADR